jgi:hypothetical protein
LGNGEDKQAWWHPGLSTFRLAVLGLAGGGIIGAMLYLSDLGPLSSIIGGLLFCVFFVGAGLFVKLLWKREGGP